MENIDRKFLNKLWNGETVRCPKCNGDFLIPLHKKKKDNNDWQCPNCKEIYRTIKILHEMLSNGQ